MTTATPPQWAEDILRGLLPAADREAISGDLLEQYRDSIVAARGQAGANRWYVAQVAHVAWRMTRLWALLFAAAGITRAAIDWLAPTQDFQLRSTVSTFVGMGILVCAGFVAAWRSGTLGSAAVVGLATTSAAAVISVAGTSALLAIWHDPQTMAAIRGSGGLAEAFTLPVMLILPGLLLGTAGGVLGSLAHRIAR